VIRKEKYVRYKKIKNVHLKCFREIFKIKQFHILQFRQAWLYCSVRNASIDDLPKVKRPGVSELGLQSATTAEQSVLHTIIQTETIDHIIQTIGKLPPQCRRIFRLFYLHGKSYNEIAKELNLSPQTVRNQKQRAAKLLRKMILPLLFLLSLYSFL
jgi:RNA polymerase sigma factor (sigma-70 family)